MQQREVFRTSRAAPEEQPFVAETYVQTELVIEVWLQYLSQLGKHSHWLAEQQSVIAQTEAETHRRIEKMRAELNRIAEQLKK